MRGPTSLRDGESRPGVGRCLKSGILAKHFHIARRQREVELLSCSATSLRGSGQWNTRNALPHYVGVEGSGAPTICCTA